MCRKIIIKKRISTEKEDDYMNRITYLCGKRYNQSSTMVVIIFKTNKYFVRIVCHRTNYYYKSSNNNKNWILRCLRSLFAAITKIFDCVNTFQIQHTHLFSSLMYFQVYMLGETSKLKHFMGIRVMRMKNIYFHEL